MKIKLVYFDFNFWRIDILRLALSYANIAYEFQRVQRENFEEKKKYPFGQLPVIFIDEQAFFCHTHSLAIFCLPSQIFTVIMIIG